MPEFLKKITKKQWQKIGKNAVILILLFALLFEIKDSKRASKQIFLFLQDFFKPFVKKSNIKGECKEYSSFAKNLYLR